MSSPDDSGAGAFARAADLDGRRADALEAFDAATTDALTKFLGPFAETFSVLHDVVLRDVPATDAVPELEGLDPEVRGAAAEAVQELVLSGAAGLVGAAVMLGVRKPDLVAAVVARSGPSNVSQGLPAYVSKGVAYTRDAVPKVAAQGRVLFNHARRNLANNKVPVVVLTAGLASAAVAWAWWEDRKDLEAKEIAQRRQQTLEEDAARLAEAAGDLEQARILFATERTEEATEVLGSLTDIGLSRLHVLRELVEGNGDYSSYDRVGRLRVAELVGLAETAAAVIASQNQTSADELPATHGGLQVGREIVRRYARGRVPGDVAGPAAAWLAAGRNTTQQANQLVLLLEQPEYLKKLARRCGNAHLGVRNGFHFEWAHELSFNLDAAAKDSDLRAHMTERLGRPADPIDLVIQNSGGETVRGAQAKVVESNSARVGPKNGLTDPKYVGMDLLLPSDHIEPTNTFLGKVLDRPEESIKTTAYKDAKSRISDSLSVGDISSDPITTGDLTAITLDPEGHVQRLVAQTRRQQALHAGFGAGGTATVMSLATDTTSYLLSEGHLDGFDWAQATLVAARTGVASAVAASAGTYLQSGAQLAIENGSDSFLHDSLANGDHGPAVTQAVIDIAAIVHGLATKRLTPEEAAEAAVTTITGSAAVWACTAAARRVVPDAEVAALVGGIVGQFGTHLLLQGVRVALLGRDTSSEWDAAYDALLADVAALEVACAAEREELAVLADAYRVRFHEDVLPALGRLNAVGSDALANLQAVATHFGSAPTFGDLDAFDAYMADATTALVLDLGRG